MVDTFLTVAAQCTLAMTCDALHIAMVAVLTITILSVSSTLATGEARSGGVDYRLPGRPTSSCSALSRIYLPVAVASLAVLLVGWPLAVG